ncbi:HAMP domain-containing histidine kinase [Nakamurella flavida]|uniref:histidine kinase n=1 Tax=Nakamurella flavida TaxID=363630 RepID=A0A938YDH5_9ACTN|nr:HAMP domain-containing sensor histidine kinase [Nakamurella flavida]MBM9475670.1 HAMP domain-containing histidine kinase [Nakamurella flavida]MDP9778053.1 two-component system OmpR family sensor kinase [Nakamurella flavida]
MAPTGRRRTLTLRTKLTVWMTALIVAVCAVIAVATEVAISGYLVHQLDERLTSAQKRTEQGAGGIDRDGDAGGGIVPRPYPTTGTDCGGPSFLVAGGASDGTLGARVVDGTVESAGVVQSAASCTVVPDAVAAELAGLVPGATPQTITLAGFGDYRVSAAEGRYGDVLITGLPLADVQDTQRRLAVVMALVSGIALLAGGLAVLLIVRRAVRPLERVAATAREVATLPLDRGEVDLGVRVPARDTDPRTEVGQVGAALNQMLGHVSGALSARQASETRVRQFVADASHELRTPLAAIRGYAELARREGDDPEGVAHALRRVQSESERMTSLVDDLLLLARLDSGRPLDRTEVDLTMLVIDAVSDAQVAGRDHHWRLDLPDEPVATVGDPARLHQIVANLLANARTHTPPGTTVVTGVAGDADGVRIEVRDDGPGIPAGLQPEIFHRFVRGDSSRSRTAGSTGLGLAIVAAVTAAHTGRVEVDSRPGRTVFTVHLPVSGADVAPAVPESFVPAETDRP